MKLPYLLLGALVMLQGAGVAYAIDFVSVSTESAILYDAPSLQAKKKFIVNRYMPLEQVSSIDGWTKIRDSKGGLFWIEKRVLSNKRFVFALNPLVDIYAAADSSSTRVFQVRQQVALEWLEANGAGWVKVRHIDGETGYVKSSDIWGD